MNLILTAIPRFKKGILLLLFFCINYSLFAQNPIANENALMGNSSTEWDIEGAGDLTIQGFATKISVNTGESIDFKIDVQGAGTDYSIKIYRLGYYYGAGARLITTLSGPNAGLFPGIAQPEPNYENATGKTDCSNWSVTASWNTTGAVSGLYLAKLTRADNNGSSHIAFVIRNDLGHADILFKTSDATWQAYNVYGGNSLYVAGTPVAGFNHATKVSYNRPFLTRSGGGGGGASEDWLFNAEYPMIRWLERNGYNVSYTTDADIDRDPTIITPAIHKILMTTGHDEYWSAGARATYETARNNGVHLAFFSGNELYWKTRWEDNHRTLVCFKEGTTGENVCGSKCDLSTNTWTGTWRDGSPATYPGSDGGYPENALSGQISWDPSTTSIVVPDTYKDFRFWRNTSVAALGAGQSMTMTDGTLGYEWDWEQAAFASFYPKGRITLSSTNYNNHNHKLSLYRHSSGALVFGAGTVQWSWGLDDNHDRGNAPPTLAMQQATVNLFADMGVQPVTPHNGIVAATASADFTAPISVISSPSNLSVTPTNLSITISGTATDNAVIAGVEVSFDNGLTWKLANGTSNWSIAWTPTTEGSFTIKSRGYDDSGNMEGSTASNTITITVDGMAPINCPCTIFNEATESPINTTLQNDGQPVMVGVKFRPSIDGYITGLKFYKSAGNNGIHSGHLWSSAGNILVSATFVNETASGWQQVNLGNPVAVTAGVTYIASYLSINGHYNADDNYFTTAKINGPLEALSDSEDPNGVYVNSANPLFPDQNFEESNYWVDVVFDTQISADVTAPLIVSVSPINNATSVSANTTVFANFNEELDPSTVSITSMFLKKGNNLVPAAVTYNSLLERIVLTPQSPLENNTTYTATIKGGIGYDRIKDVAGNALSSDYVWTFTTAGPPPPPPVEGLGGPILVISESGNAFSRYPIEMLRAEGYNSFDALDITQVDVSALNNHDVVILGEISLTAPQISLLTNWVNAGGTLIAMKPDPQLYSLLGITDAGGSIADKYLLINTNSGPGIGITNQTIQFHGSANRYNLNGATTLATLYSTATTATTFPAITTIDVGINGGKAIAFAYDLARSVVYTRQGNPAWAGQSRDGQAGPIRSDNLYFGSAAGDPQPDYVDFNKIQIPQADEQQRLLSNIIALGNLHRKPLPKFWFLPRKLKAAIVMTGDDHANGGTIERFNRYKTLSGAFNSPQDVLDWKAIRSTSYILSSTSTSTISDAQAAAFEADGFEMAAHLSTNCGNFNSAADLNSTYFTPQLAEFATKWPSVPSPKTNRTHCIAWSDWATQPKEESLKGIRLDANYYYWPGSWIQNRAGMFTGSGMPMRFADLDGTLIDCYQLTTQMPDESGIQWPGFINTLLDNAIGSNGYYGVFCANMHTDVNTPGDQSVVGSEAIIQSAIARNIPVISARQLLTWLDGRNGSNFENITWSGNNLSFTISMAAGSHQLQGMVPVNASSGTLTGITLNGAPVTYTSEVIKGINYAFFDAAPGNFIANYNHDVTGPIITNIVATPNNDGTATITWTTNEPATSIVNYSLTANSLNLTNTNTPLMTSHSVILTGLFAATTYYFAVTSADASNNSATSPVPPATLNFTMPPGPCATDITSADFNAGTVDANTIIVANGDGGVSLNQNLNDEFPGSALSSFWGSGIFNAGGSTVVNANQVTVDGAHIFSNNSFGPGTIFEFQAIFSSASFQNIGLSDDQPFNTNPWVTIGQGPSPDGNLYARSSNGDAINLGALLNTPHQFKIKWNATNFEFFIDGNTSPAATINFSIATAMYIQISDVNTGGGVLIADWIRATPYLSPGTYTSRIFDAGSATTWGTVNWNAITPANTSITIFVRKGNTPIADGSWSSFTEVTNGGIVICGSSRYIQYQAILTTSDPAVAPVLNDISINCGAPADVTPPVISNLVVSPNSNGNSLITWTTDEASTSSIDYGTYAGIFDQSNSDPALVINHSITLTGLTQGSTYFYKISSSDCSNNTTVSNVAIFTIPFATSTCFQDNYKNDFTQGTTGSDTYVSSKNDGEVILKPSTAEEFNGTSIPSGWGSFAWTGGSSTLAGGVVTVDGARLNTISPMTNFNPGTSIEFKATFGAEAFQHAGFGGGTDATNTGGIYNGDNAWAMFSTGNQTSILRARTFIPGGGGLTEDFDIPGSAVLIGSEHLYKIIWNTSSIEYFVDGILVHTVNATITETMRPAISDYNNNGIGISVNWMYISPYAASGIFESRIFDAGNYKNWMEVNWTADIPAGTNLQIYQRQSNSAINILSASWQLVTASGSTVGGTSRYIQYKAELTTSDALLTPVLKDISFSCSDITPIIIAGNVWHDVNANTDNYVNNSGILQLPPAVPIPATLRAYLVNFSTGLVEKIVSINPSIGTYQFSNVMPFTNDYYVIISTSFGITGAPPPSITLPSGWIHTGQKLSPNINLSPGTDGLNDGRLITPITNSNIINANFGIKVIGGDIVVG